MKNSLILLPLLLILAIVIFFILMSQAVTKETENTIPVFVEMALIC